MEPIATGPADAPTPGPSAPRGPSRWWRRPAWSTARIVTVYAAVALGWILFSDALLSLAVPDPATRERLQTVKGVLYVGLTSVLLFALIRRIERSLASFGGEIRSAVDSMMDGVMLIDPEGRIAEVNRAALELLGATEKAQVLGPIAAWGERYQARFLDGTPVPVEQFASLRALRGERVPAYDALLRRLDGQDVYVSVSAAPVEAGGRTGRLAVTVLRDVSQARRLDETRDEFLSTAAHELKTPLAVIKAYAQVVQRRVPAEAPALTVVQRQVERLTRLVQHLLDSSRLRLEPVAGAHQPFDLAALAAEVVARARTTAPGHEVTLAAAPLAQVRGDRERIGRVLASLIDNAVRYSPGGGPVAASLAVDGREAVVSVQDHGPGIPPDRQARIFERYYRAHSGTPEDYGGLGLSLNMSREIVVRHGGRMWFESVPGEGSTFRFALPLSGEEGA
ncbi:MAG: ATP-binding protein [Anaeromyxobacter sp.]